MACCAKMPTQLLRPPNSCFFRSSFDLYRGGLIPIPSQRSRRSGMGMRPPLGFYLFEHRIILYLRSALSLVEVKQQKKRFPHAAQSEKEPRLKWRGAQGRGGASRRRGCKNYFAMALRAAIRPNTTHSPILPAPWYMLPQIEPNSPVERRFSIGLFLHLCRDARREHDCRCDHDSLHDSDAV